MKFNVIGEDGAIYRMTIDKGRQNASEVLSGVADQKARLVGTVGTSKVFVCTHPYTHIVKRIENFDMLTRFSIGKNDDGSEYMYPTWDVGVNMKLKWAPPSYAKMFTVIRFIPGTVGSSIYMYLAIRGKLYGFPCQNVFLIPAGLLCAGDDARLGNDSLHNSNLAVMDNIEKYIFTTPWNNDAGIEDKENYKSIFKFNLDGTQVIDSISEADMVEASRVVCEDIPHDILLKEML